MKPSLSPPSRQAHTHNEFPYQDLPQIVQIVGDILSSQSKQIFLIALDLIKLPHTEQNINQPPQRQLPSAPCANSVNDLSLPVNQR